jgi:hypothetical protein
MPTCVSLARLARQRFLCCVKNETQKSRDQMGAGFANNFLLFIIIHHALTACNTLLGTSILHLEAVRALAARVVLHVGCP